MPKEESVKVYHNGELLKEIVATESVFYYGELTFLNEYDFPTDTLLSIRDSEDNRYRKVPHKGHERNRYYFRKIS